MNPKYPVYVITKGRWDSNLTANALDRMKVPYNLVVEPQEYEYYALAVNPDKILTLPFSNLERGSIPARNWVWEHSMSTGASKHWILDDNIEAFNRLNRNMKLEVDTGSIFRAAEDFVDRYENIAISGFNYYSFCKATDCLPPYYLNTRVYSCLLIKNDIDFRWRGRYNEDTDLCLRVLKAGYCTVLFNAFLAGKVTTMRMKGGNTDELYADDGRKKMAEAIVDLHPDVARVTKKFGRWHHQIDYRPFRKNRLIKKKDLNIPNKVNNYGMVIKKMEKTK